MSFSAENDTDAIERDSNGDLVIMSPAGSDGSERNAEIIFELSLWNRQTGRTGKVTEAEGGYRLADTSVRVPDAAWTSNERLSSLSKKQMEGYAPICPQFIIGLRSPRSSPRPGSQNADVDAQRRRARLAHRSL